MSSCRVIRVSPKSSAEEPVSPQVSPVTWDTFTGDDEVLSAGGRPLSPVQNPAHALDATTQEAERLLAEAREEAGRVRQTAYAEGYEQGERVGRESIEEEYRYTLEAAREEAEVLLAEAKRQRERTLQSMQDVITDVVMASVEALLHTPHIVERAEVTVAVSQLLETEVRGSRVVVRMHPDDLRVQGPTVLEELRLPDAVSLRPDETLSRGGYVIETDSEEIDATLEMGLELLKPKVRQLIGGLLDERVVGVPGGL